MRGTPPRRSQTPSATRSRSGFAAAFRAAFVRTLKAANIRCSSAEPASGTSPIWRASAIPSGTASLRTILPSSTRRRSIPSSSMCAPVGSRLQSCPVIVAVAFQCTATLSSWATVVWTVSEKSGNAVNSSVKYSRTPCGPTASTWLAMCSCPSGAQSAAIASTSRRESAAK